MLWNQKVGRKGMTLQEIFDSADKFLAEYRSRNS